MEEVRESGVCDGGEVLNQQVNLTLDWHSYYSPNKAVVTTSRIEPFVIAHEVFHSLGLPHSWVHKDHTDPNKKDLVAPNGKYSFKHLETYNSMDYHSLKYHIYYWQAKIANENALTEPNDYKPE